MEYKKAVKYGTVISAVLLTLVTLLSLWIFAAAPSLQLFTTVLLLTMIMMQLLTVIVLVHIHDLLGRGKR